MTSSIPRTKEQFKKAAFGACAGNGSLPVFGFDERRRVIDSDIVKKIRDEVGEG